MTERFYSSGPLTEPTVLLTGSEAHHLMHVLRIETGRQVELFDGRGTVAAARIGALTRDSVTLHILSTHKTPAAEPPPIHLATAVPKGDRFRMLVEKVTELGVETLIPLTTARSVVVPRSGKLEKLRQTVVAACKQSGRNRLMEIRETIDWTELITARFSDHSVWVAHPSGEPVTDCIDHLAGDRPILLCVGPEGGFTDEEVAAASTAGARIVSLGRVILRIETAAIALCAFCAWQWKRE